MRLTLLVVLSLMPVPLAAQEPGSDPTPPSRREEYPTGQVFPLLGAHYNSATGATAHIAVIRVSSATIHGYGGTAISADIGTTGGKLGIASGGYSFVVGGLLRASYMQSWGDGPLQPGQGYVGADLRIQLFVVSLGVSEHIRVHGDAPGDGSIFAWSVGVGF